MQLISRTFMAVLSTAAFAIPWLLAACAPADDNTADDEAGDGDGDMETTGKADGDTTASNAETTGDGDGDMEATGDGDASGLCAGDCTTPNCGTCPDGPAAAASFDDTIDSTEVTNGQYAPFLDVEFAPAHLAELLPDGCEFKTDFTPDGWPMDPPANIPVAGVDWCDAMAYCSWSGKHLCGAVGGGSAAVGDVQNPASNEWFRACTSAGVNNYPYGLTYDGIACNTLDAGYGQRVEAGSFTDCEGGVTGCFDMSGNVWEWTNACTPAGECQRRGGSFSSDEATSRCAINSVRPRELRSNDTGFRCCDSA